MRGTVSYLERPGARLAMAVHRAEAPGIPIVSLRPPQFSHVEAEWDAGSSHNEFDAYHPRHPVIRFDARGTGLSTRDCPDHGLDVRVSDLEAVIDAAGAGPVILDAISSSALTALAFAARHPQRAHRLVVQNAFVDGRRWWANPVRRALLNIAELDWPLCTETWAWLTWGDESRERTLRLADYIRSCIGPEAFLAIASAEREIDLREEIRAIAAPSLVLNHPRFARMAPEEYNAEVALGIPGAVLHSVHSTQDRVAAINAFIGANPLPSPSSSDRSDPFTAASSLTVREVEVLRLVAEGLKNQEIADRLVVSVRTVDAHVRNIFVKTHTHSRAGATAFGIRANLL